MIQQAINSMIALLMAKFIINDMPHAVGLLGNPGPVQNREQIAASHWEEILKYCHTVDDLRKIASGQGVVKVYHGAPTEYAEIMVKEGPQVPYAVEDTARYVAKLYGLRWIEFAPYAYRKREVREKLSTSTAPIAARWAWTFPLGEVLTDLNGHARLVVAALGLCRSKGIKLRDAMDELYDRAGELAKARGERFTFEGAANVLGLPDKLALKAKTGALVEITVDTKVMSDLGSHDARYYLEEVGAGRLPLKDALLFWNHEYRDFRIAPSDIRSMRIVVRNMQPWEQDIIEGMIKEERLSPYCGV